MFVIVCVIVCLLLCLRLGSSLCVWLCLCLWFTAHCDLALAVEVRGPRGEEEEEVEEEKDICKNLTTLT